MSRLSKFLGKSEIIEIEGEKLEIKPLKVKDMDLLLNLGDDRSRTEAMHSIIVKTIKEAVPDATSDEIDNVGVQYAQQIMEAVMRVNGLDKGAKVETKRLKSKG